MKKFAKYIRKGIEEPLEKIPFHRKAPLKRLLMLDNKLISESNIRIAVHSLKDLPKKISKYGKLHKHNFDEINLILSEKGNLKYKIQFENEIHEVKSPSTIFIPKGVRHVAEVISGEGFFICILLNKEYSASK